jgi:hypothetical protein
MSGKDLGEALYVAMALFPLIPFAIAGAVAEKRATEARIADYLNKEFKDVVLSKDASAHGFVFFMPPGTLWFTKGRLVLHFVDETDGPALSSACLRVNQVLREDSRAPRKEEQTVNPAVQLRRQLTADTA